MCLGVYVCVGVSAWPHRDIWRCRGLPRSRCKMHMRKYVIASVTLSLSRLFLSLRVLAVCMSRPTLCIDADVCLCVCVYVSYPNNIIHCIEWSRDDSVGSFNSLFTEGPQDVHRFGFGSHSLLTNGFWLFYWQVNAYLNDPDSFLVALRKRNLVTQRYAVLHFYFSLFCSCACE